MAQLPLLPDSFSRHFRQFPERRIVAFCFLEVFGFRENSARESRMILPELLDAQSRGGTHPFGNGTHFAKTIENDAISLGYSRDWQQPMLISQAFTRLRRFQHGVNHSVINMRSEQFVAVTPLG